MKEKKLILSSLIDIITYYLQLFLFPISKLTYLIPRNKKIWVFGSTFGKRFADNPKYFYLYMNQYHKKDIRAIWISKNRDVIKLLNHNGMEAYYLYSIKGIWFCLRARVYLYDNYSKDICFTLSGGAVKINMWHGVPLKKIQRDNRFDKVRHPKTRTEMLKSLPRRMSDEKPSDYVLTTSNFLKPIFSSAFQTKRVIVCGYPRNDNLVYEQIRNILTKQETREIRHISKKAQENKIILYMPTFRESESKFFDVINMDKFQKFLVKEHLIFCIKLHPKSKLEMRFREKNYSNIYILDAQSDPYSILNLSDLLVTDYSSIYFDYLLTKKPIVFFNYDLAEYLRDTRELYFSYNKFTPGIKVKNQTELEKALVNPEYDEKQIEKILIKILGKNSMHASQNLFYEIRRIVH